MPPSRQGLGAAWGYGAGFRGGAGAGGSCTGRAGPGEAQGELCRVGEAPGVCARGGARLLPLFPSVSSRVTPRGCPVPARLQHTGSLPQRAVGSFPSRRRRAGDTPAPTKGARSPHRWPRPSPDTDTEARRAAMLLPGTAHAPAADGAPEGPDPLRERRAAVPRCGHQPAAAASARRAALAPGRHRRCSAALCAPSARRRRARGAAAAFPYREQQRARRHHPAGTAVSHGRYRQTLVSSTGLPPRLRGSRAAVPNFGRRAAAASPGKGAVAHARLPGCSTQIWSPGGSSEHGTARQCACAAAELQYPILVAWWQQRARHGAPSRMRGSPAAVPHVAAGRQHPLTFPVPSTGRARTERCPSPGRTLQRPQLLTGVSGLTFLCPFPPRSPDSNIHRLLYQKASKGLKHVSPLRLTAFKVWWLFLFVPPTPLPQGKPQGLLYRSACGIRVLGVTAASQQTLVREFKKIRQHRRHPEGRREETESCFVRQGRLCSAGNGALEQQAADRQTRDTQLILGLCRVVRTFPHLCAISTLLS